MNFNTLIFLVLISSCSFKNPESDKGKNVQRLIVDGSADFDGDRIKNVVDVEPLIADVPTFEGEMLEEIKIEATFYNRATDKFANTELLVKSDDENMVVKKGMSYIRALVEDAVAYTHITNSHFAAEISESLINMYSAPIITDSGAHNYMAKASDFETNGFSLDTVEFEIRNRINIQSERFKSFRDIIFDVYFYDYQTKRLEFLDSFKNNGSFEFNKDHHLDITNIKTRNARILDNSVLKTGRFLLVKLKDFYIPEIQTNYSELIAEVRNKTIPLILNSPDEYKVKYVGTDGVASGIMPLFKAALKDDFEVDENRFIKYKEFPVGEYRSEDSDGNRVNVESKWHLVTNSISNNPFTYSFLPTDLIFLNYSKSNDPALFAKTISSCFSDTKKEILIKGENLLPQALRKIKIVLSSLVVQQPRTEEVFVNRRNCARHDHPNSINTYLKTRVVIRPEALEASDSRFESLLKNTFLEIDGFEYSLGKLISEKKFESRIESDGKIFLESTEPFIKSVRGLGNDFVRFSMIHKIQSVNIETNERMYDCGCHMCGSGRCVRDRPTCESIQLLNSSESQPINYSFYTSVFIY